MTNQDYLRINRNAPDAGLYPHIPGKVSDELYSKSIGMLNADPLAFSSDYKWCVIHLIDSVSRGYTTPAEAYEALAAPYFPEWLRVRRSYYEKMV